MAVENSGTESDAILNFTLIKGEKGEPGKAATVEVGTVAIGDTDAVSITNSGDSQNAVFDFVIPKGKDGKDGVVSLEGINGNEGDILQYINGTWTATDVIGNIMDTIGTMGGGNAYTAKNLNMTTDRKAVLTGIEKAAIAVNGEVKEKSNMTVTVTEGQDHVL